MILYDIIWYYMILYDIIWYYMILYDIIWYYMILYDIIWYYMILYVDITRVSQPQSKSLMPSTMVWSSDMAMFLRNWYLNWTYRHQNTTASHHASHRSPLFPGDAGPCKDCRVGVVYLQINSTTCFANDPGRLQHFDHHIKSIHSLVEQNGNG